MDLEAELPEDMKKRFDVVFNHTTLEHIFRIEKAFENLCAIAKEVCIIVVPFVQEVHIGDSFKDYWRFTPFAIEQLFYKNGFSLVVCEFNNDFDTAVYLFCIAVRNEVLDKYPQFHRLEVDNHTPAGSWIGNDHRLFSRIKNILGGYL